MKAFILVCLVALLSISGARIFERCELARELLNQGIPRKDVASWVCLAESVTGTDTSVIAGPNPDGSYNHGLFQINDRWWCMIGKPGHECNVSCEDLRTDDIGASVKCALLIKQRQGWNGWRLWQYTCQRGIPSVDDCFKRI